MTLQHLHTNLMNWNNHITLYLLSLTVGNAYFVRNASRLAFVRYSSLMSDSKTYLISGNRKLRNFNTYLITY